MLNCLPAMVAWSDVHIQEEQLSVSGERTCTILVNRLEDYVSLSSKSVVR